MDNVALTVRNLITQVGNRPENSCIQIQDKEYKLFKPEKGCIGRAEFITRKCPAIRIHVELIVPKHTASSFNDPELISVPIENPTFYIPLQEVSPPPEKPNLALLRNKKTGEYVYVVEGESSLKSTVEFLSTHPTPHLYEKVKQV